MNLIQVISWFLGSPSKWTITSRTGTTIATGLGGGYWRLALTDPQRHNRSLYFYQVQAGFSVPLSTDDLPAESVRSLLGRSGQIFRRPLLDRELIYDDFLGPARALSVGPFSMICVGGAATIASLAFTGAPPASIAAQIWGSRLIGFVTPGGPANPRIPAEAVFALGYCAEDFPPDFTLRNPFYE